MGVGIGIGVPTLVALGVFAGWMLRASNKQSESAPKSQGTPHSWIPLDIHKSQYRARELHESPGHIGELPGQEPTYELPPVASRRGSLR
jgi:hypothetical protein